MSFVGISIWFSPSVNRPRSVTLGDVMKCWPAGSSSRSSPCCKIAQLFAGMFKLPERSPSQLTSRDSIDETRRDAQERDHVILRSAGASAALHPDLVAPAEGDARDLVDDVRREVRLVDDGEDVVRALDRVRDEARVLDHEHVVLRVRDDRGLVLRDLDDGQAVELDHRVRHWRSRERETRARGEAREAYGHMSRATLAPTSCAAGRRDTAPRASGPWASHRG